MLVAKQVADLITLMRALFAFWLAWLGVNGGVSELPMAAWLLVGCWTSDALDGPVARRSRESYASWVGDHDLVIDILVAVGALIFLLGAGFVNFLAAAVYLLVWAAVFWRWGLLRSPGMLFQAPIYGWFLWVALTQAPLAGLWLVAWIGAAVVLTWPKFPAEIVPGFLAGFRELRAGR